MNIDLDAMPTEDREELLVEVFQWIRQQGGRLPLRAYAERVKTWHTVFVDVAVIQKDIEGRVYILLERRPKTGYLYPGMYDIPGGNFTFRETAQEAAARIASKLGFTEKPWFAGVATYTKTEAEIGVSLLFVLEVGRDALVPEGCAFFPLRETMASTDFVPWQRETYPTMIYQFVARWHSTLEEYLGQ